MIAYIYAGIFAAMFVIGRILEPFLFRRTLRKTLAGEFPETELEPALAE